LTSLTMRPATTSKTRRPRKPEFNRENVHRAKLRVEERHWQMARLDPRLWGERQTIDLKGDWPILSEEERRRKADEMIAMIREMQTPLQPPPLVYRPQEAPDDDEPPTGGIGVP
jgi:hypothetical protein